MEPSIHPVALASAKGHIQPEDGRAGMKEVRLWTSLRGVHTLKIVGGMVTVHSNF